MYKKHIIISFFLMALLLVACSSSNSEQSIQTAVAQTIAAMPTITPAVNALGTPNPTSLPVYVVEVGFCTKSSESSGPITGNPTGHSGCLVTQRSDVTIGPGEGVVKTGTDDTVLLYCSLYLPDGTYLMSAIDRTGSLQVICSP